MKDFALFEEKTGITFTDKDLLKQAFLHRSYLNEHPKIGMHHNERLEFLGDAVLELVVTKHLYTAFPEKPEGELTALRAALVNTNTLATAAGEAEMNDFLLLSRGEAKDTGRARQYILANTFEAFIGSVYLDQGYDKAESFIGNTLFHRLDEIVSNRLWQDPKSLFQEKAQEVAGVTPAYRIIQEAGPDHDKRFVSAVFLDDEQVAKGEGRSKQEAEEKAAEMALQAKKWSK